MLTKDQITRNWLPRYTGMPLEKFGNYILVTNFSNYVKNFNRRKNLLEGQLGHFFGRVAGD